MSKLFISPFFIIAFLCLATGCNKKQQDPTISFFTIDVSQKYPEKEINLEELADLELIRLEFDEDYLFKRQPYLITENYIFFFDQNNSDCKLFTRKGQPVAQFNKQGGGPEEHKNVQQVLLDEKENQFYMFSSNKVWIYSLTGDFIHHYSLPDSVPLYSAQLYDDNNFLCYTKGENVPFSFFLLSKKDFTIQEEIVIPFPERVHLAGSSKDGSIRIVMHAINMAKHPEGFLLTEHSNDTVFLYNNDHELIPVLTRIPSIHTTDPIIYLESFLETKDFYFMESMELIFDFEKFSFGNKTRLMVEKETEKVYQPKIRWNEYKDYSVSLPIHNLPITNNPKLGFLFLSLDKLLDAYDENKLSGRLKEFVEQLDEDDNNVLVLLHYK